MQLADTSAWVWSRRPGLEGLRSGFDTLIEADEIATCDMVRLELLYSARNEAEFRELAADLQALVDCSIGGPVWQRALWVYGELAGAGGAHQRAVKHPDLLIAAAAEVAVLHYDEDFERIAAITGQAHRWLARPGSLAPS